MENNEDVRQAHNQKQIDYFSSRTKKTMVPETTPYVLRNTDKLVNFAGIQPGDSVLEVGCGMGHYTLDLAERGFNVHGLDLTPFLLGKLEEYNNGRYDIELHCADIVDHPSELDNRFDAVAGFFVLHHLHDLRVCFKAMADMAKPGGTLVFMEPNAFSPHFYLQMMITPGMTWEGDGGIVRMRKSILLDAMHYAGLTDVELTRFGFFPPGIYNRPWGAKLDSVMESIPLWRGLLPFQLCKGVKK